MLEELREQVIQEDELFELEEERDPILRRIEGTQAWRLIAGIRPWQRLVLAALLFLDVAVCGCLMLIMTGRVVYPF
jgi:hypothetical protein